MQQDQKNINKILFHTKNKAKIFSLKKKKRPPYGEHSHSLEKEITKIDLGFIQ